MRGGYHFDVLKSVTSHDSAKITIFLGVDYTILGLQSISRDAENNGSHPRRLDPTMELITYSFVLYLQNGRRDVKCKPSILGNESAVKAAAVILFNYEIF